MMGGGEEPIMTLEEDERPVANVLRDEGWAATVTPAVHDVGLDVIAERRGSRLGVQAKMVRQGAAHSRSKSSDGRQITVTR